MQKYYSTVAGWLICALNNVKINACFYDVCVDAGIMLKTDSEIVHLCINVAV